LYCRLQHVSLINPIVAKLVFGGNVCYLVSCKNRTSEVDVRGSVHHSTNTWRKIQQDTTMYQNFIHYLCEAQHVSGDTPPIIRSLKLHWQPLVFHIVWWRVVGGQRPPTTHPTTFHVWKTRGCQCSFRLLMMGGMSPETCWASHK